MIYADGRRRNQWGRNGSVPDVRPAGKPSCGFYFLAASYIDVGCEAIHFGQVERLMNGNDRDLRHYTRSFR